MCLNTGWDLELKLNRDLITVKWNGRAWEIGNNLHPIIKAPK